jgi:NADH-quinone oxidoreductase subunit H
MGVDLFESIVNCVKVLVIFLMMVQLVPILVWVERRGSAFIQSRLGPNRVGPLGLTQLLADAVKFLAKEEFIPAKGKKLIFYGAPIVALVPAALAFGSIPLSSSIYVDVFQWLGRSWGPYTIELQSFHFGVGIVFVLGVSSLASYSILMAGWGSNNKYSMMGALRASAQMISYELALGLALVGAVLVYGTFDFTEILAQQAGPLAFTFAGKNIVVNVLPNWGIFYQPLGALIYFAAIFAETNRLPFDLPEAEGELVAGYHTEYGGLKMLMFYIGEYGHMLVGSALMVVFYFGGYQIPFIESQDIAALFTAKGFGVTAASGITALLLHVVFLVKVLFFLWVFIWVRWTLPRFRYDQLMDLGWKTMLPWALANTIVTAAVMVFAGAQ